MLEKPKRAKQLNNQDRQLPATIQELINRYDLENKDIYKFLDYLVDNINENKSEIVDNLESESTTNALSANQGRVLNEKIASLNQEIEKRSIISTTDEVKTGETWIDGKPIYRKSFTFAVDSTTHKMEIDISDLNIKLGLFDLNNSYINNTAHSRYTPIITTNVSTDLVATAYSSSQTFMYFNYTYTELIVEFGHAITGGAFVTIRYTKTTD